MRSASLLSVICCLLCACVIACSRSGPETRVITVGPERVDCVGVAPRKCLQIKQSGDAEYSNFYDEIEGFEYEDGTVYELEVEVTRVDDPPADASALRYRLIRVSKREPHVSSIEGRRWRIEALRVAAEPGDAGVLEPLPEEVAAHLALVGGELTGNAGCNRFFGDYDAQPGGGLRFSTQTGVTLMACPPPIERLERRLLTLLPQVVSWRLAEGTLELVDAEGQSVMRLAAAILMPLVGTSWKATGINNGRGGVAATRTTGESTAVFTEGQVSGNAGCNRYSASFVVKGQAISIGPAMTTRRHCAEPEGIMDQEQEFLQALGRARRLSVLGGERLELRDEGGSLQLAFEADDGA